MAGVFCGFVVFVCSFITHIALPLGSMGVSVIPQDKEAAIIQVMKSSLDKPGLYFFPGVDMGKAASEEDMKAWTERIKAGPNGILIYNPTGQDPMSPTQMLRQFIFMLIGGLIVAFIISQMTSSIFMKAFCSALMGVFAWLAISLPEWNWYSFPIDYVIGVGIDRVICWFMGGLMAAFILRPRE